MNNNRVTPIQCEVPIIGFVGYSGSGKTTLLEKIIKHSVKYTWRIAVIKHAHHRFEIDYPGKDSYILRKAGAQQTLIASNQRWALINEGESVNEPDLPTLIAKINQNQIDILYVEGFKHENLNKIEIHRTGLGHEYLFPSDPNVVAIASDSVKIADCPIKQLDINDSQEVFDFITQYVK